MAASAGNRLGQYFGRTMRGTLWKFAFLHLAAAIGLLLAPAADAAGTLRAYNADIHETSVSGLSSGAFMAVQLDVAFSSIIKGAGIIAGGPYYCAQGVLDTAVAKCMNASTPIDVANLVRLTRESAQRDEIDDPVNLHEHRIWLFSGGKDSVVDPSVLDALEDYYKALVNHANVAHRTRANAEHTMPTQTYGNNCPVKDDPYISDCNYDAAGTLLQWIYGNLNAKATTPLHGKLIEFDQGDFIANPNAHGMADTGWVFVPENCSAQAPYRLHVALHAAFNIRHAATSAMGHSSRSAPRSPNMPDTTSGPTPTASSCFTRRPSAARRRFGICSTLSAATLRAAGTGGDMTTIRITRSAAAARWPRSGR